MKYAFALACKDGDQVEVRSFILSGRYRLSAIKNLFQSWTANPYWLMTAERILSTTDEEDVAVILEHCGYYYDIKEI